MAVTCLSMLKGKSLQIPHFIGKARVKGEHGVPQHALILLAELPADDADELLLVEVEHRTHQAQDKHVLSTIPRGAADRLHRGSSERNARCLMPRSWRTSFTSPLS